jgi:bacteriochlorophyll C8 methyltransferase
MSSPDLSHARTLLAVPSVPVEPVHGSTVPPESLRPLKILLVMPKGKQEEDSGQKPLFTMAIAVLVSITPRQHSVEIADDLFGDEINYDGDYDLVGITTRTLNATRAYEIADEFKKRGTTVVIGGVHVSFNYDEAAPHCDSVVIGEAESLWTTVLEDVAFGRLRPYYHSQDFPSVNEAPVIDYERIFKASKRPKVDARKSIPIYITRGCPYSCSFCVTPNFTGKLYRMQSPEAIREQIERAKQVFFKHTRYGDKPWFMFTDENLGVNKKKLWDILEVIKDCNIRFSSFISLNFLEDPKTVRLLVEAGCAMALVGFESINEETLKFYNKSRQNSVEKFTRIIRQCREAGLCVQGNFLTNPAIDSFEDMDAVEEFVRKNHIVMPIYSLITPYPGTAMYLEYKEKGLVVDEDWDKYTAANLVVKSDKFDPFEYQVKYLEHYLAMYSWKTIFTRVLNNSNKLINFVTSAYFRKNLQDQLKNVKAGRRRPVGQEAVVAEAEAQPQVATEAVKG